jgi:putative ABC transport system permease protein
MRSLALAFRYARRELRSGLSGFRVFLACLTLGVAAIAGVGSLGQAFLTGLSEQGRTLLGGDVNMRRLYVPAEEDEIAFMERFGRVSLNATMRSMAAAPNGTRTVVELKAVDAAYPMLGAVTLEPEANLRAALACTPQCGVAVEELLFSRLGIGIGSNVHIGDADYVVRARLVSEPDRITGGFTLGPRVMLSTEALGKSGLITEGSLIQYHYDIAFSDPEMTTETFETALEEELPDNTWRVRDHENALPDVERFVRQATMFLSLVALTALVVGGVGAGQAIGAFIDRRRASIATLKALGAEGNQIFLIYMMMVLLVAAIGLVLGLIIGAALPYVIEHFFGARIPAPANYAVYAGPLFLAAAFGVLTAFAFAVLPLSRAREISPSGLFRDLVAPSGAHGRWPYRFAALGALLAIVALAVALSRYTEFTLGFLAGSAVILVLLRYAGLGLRWAIARLPRSQSQVLRLAFSGLTRPGTQSVQVIIALGLGLSLLATVTLVEASVRAEVEDQLPDQAPSFFFVDIQKADIDAFTRMVTETPSAEDFRATPMLRGRIVRLGGVGVEELRARPDSEWIPTGDRGLTYAAAKPENATIAEGPDWWPEDYQGPPLLSLEADTAEDLRLGIGDTITLNVLGRDIDATVYNLRGEELREIGVNFDMVMSPGVISAAPHTYVATVRLDPDREEGVSTAVGRAFPNVTIVRVKETLAQVGVMLEALATGIAAASTITILAGVLVLAGAIAAGHRARLYDAVVLKVLGATRGRLAAIYAVEYGLLGFLAGLAAFGAGTLAAWSVTYFVLEIDFAFSSRGAAATIIGGALGTLILGLIGGFAALSAKPAARLRNP